MGRPALDEPSVSPPVASGTGPGWSYCSHNHRYGPSVSADSVSANAVQGSPLDAIPASGNPLGSAHVSPGTAAGTAPPASATGVPELENLGQRLLQARQAQGLEVSALADRLHIGKEQIEAIETCDLAKLPEPVFVIAQARRLAGALNLDLEPDLQALRQSPWMQQANPSAKAPASRPRPPAPVGRGHGAVEANPKQHGWPRPIALPLALGLVGATGIAVAALWGLQHWHNQSVAPASSQPSAPLKADGNSPQTTANPVSRQATGSRAPTLSLSSSSPSWVEVRNSEGTTLFKGTLSGEQPFPLGEGLRVLAGRPDLVSAAVGPKAARPLGTISDVRWRSFP